MAEHRSKYMSWNNGKSGYTSSFELFDRYGIENCSIELIEIFPCNSKDELSKREGSYIRNLNCVNKNIAGRTQTDWFNVNKGKKAEYDKEYRDANRNTILEKQKEKYTCVCGSTLRKSDKSRHEKSKKHLNYISSNTI